MVSVNDGAPVDPVVPISTASAVVVDPDAVAEAAGDPVLVEVCSTIKVAEAGMTEEEGREEEGGRGARCEGGGNLCWIAALPSSETTVVIPVAEEETGVGCIGGRAETAAAKAEADTRRPRDSCSTCVVVVVLSCSSPSDNGNSVEDDPASSRCSLSCVGSVVSWGVK